MKKSVRTDAKRRIRKKRYSPRRNRTTRRSECRQSYACPFRGTAIAAAMIPGGRHAVLSRVLALFPLSAAKKYARRQERIPFRVSLGRGLIYSRCNFQYFSADRDRRGCINPRVGALLPPGGIAGQRPANF